MINRKSIEILNKKFKREREEQEKAKLVKPKKSKNHCNYNELLNGDIKVVSPSPKKVKAEESPLTNLKCKISNNKKSRNSNINETKSFEPKTFDRKSSANQANPTIADIIYSSFNHGTTRHKYVFHHFYFF